MSSKSIFGVTDDEFRAQTEQRQQDIRWRDKSTMTGTE